VLPLVHSLWGHRRLVADFVVRDLKARYVSSSMGFFWSVIFPVINLFLYMFLFRLVLNMRWEMGGNSDLGAKETALIMLAGILAWSAFAETVSRSTNCLVENANLIQKVVFPAEILPLYLTLSSLTNMLVGLPVVLIGVLVFCDTSFGASLVLAPLLLVLQALFTVGLGYFLSSFNLVLRDTYHVVGVLITVWMFMTPIFYPQNVIQDAKIPLPIRTEAELDVEFFARRGAAAGRREGAELGQTIGESLAAGAAAGVSREEAEALGAAAGARLAKDLSATLGTEHELSERPMTMSIDWLLDVNPMHWLIESWRRVLIFGTWPSWQALAKLFATGLAAFALGARFFWSQRRRFADLL
jgi:ABC-type polysaccharide/polyol phosphate export permease